MHSILNIKALNTKTKVRKLISLFFFNILIFTYSLSQQPNRFFSSGDSIFVDVLPENDIVFHYVVKTGTTFYSLAKVFNLDVMDLKAINQINNNSKLTLGKIVNVPISKDAISPIKPSTPYLCVNYKVKKKETFYTITQQYFKTTTAVLQNLNLKKTTNINEGEFLCIGYLPINSNKDVEPNQVIKPTLSIQDSSFVSTKNTISDYVIAGWDKTSKEGGGQIALFNGAKIGSVIELYNPMMRKKTSVKVIGRLPLGTYSSDISIWVSPSVAKQLCVLDSRFGIEIKYESN